VKTYYTIYKITHIPSGKFYIGRHQTKDLDDGYMGSGTYLKHAQEKHGLDQFKKEYLHIFDSDQPMYLKEQELVTKELCSRSDTYNVQPGGFNGGWQWVNNSKQNIYGMNGKTPNVKKDLVKAREKRNYLLKENSEYRKKFSEKVSKGLKKHIQENGAAWTGKTHSNESKRKIGLANSKAQCGSKNSQYGTMWITNGSENKKIKKDCTIPEGWYKGRTHASILPKIKT